MLTKYEQQGPRAKIMLYPYYATLIATSGGTSSHTQKRCTAATDTTTATMYMMFRMVFGHKTWY